MNRVVFVRCGGDEVTVEFEDGESLMQAALRAGVEGIVAECGGTLSCGTCHVYVDDAWFRQLPKASGEEDGMLNFTAAPRKPTSRLSCQIRMNATLDRFRCELPECQI